MVVVVEVQFYDVNKPVTCKYAVMLATYQGKFVLCRHQARDTWEFPGGHVEYGETVDEAAKRELLEETGATEAIFTKLAIYSVKESKQIDYGMFYHAEIAKFNEKLNHEIAEIQITEQLPKNWTYPDIQPLLLTYYQNNQ